VEAFGPVLTQLYGYSESPTGITMLHPEDHVFEGTPPERLASGGRPVYNVEVRIVDAGGRDCPPGEVGEVVSRGSNAFAGYWGDEALTAERVLDGGWIRSGDMARWDEDGYLYVVDRQDDMIITGGFNVWPAEVESVVCAHPDVGEAVVVGLPDDKWGERLTAVVVARPGRTVDEAALIAFAREHLSPYKVPKQVVVHHSPLAKSAVGKLLRRAVRDQLLQEAAT
jgi:acyl-CoA synthetase (AMP-forming)/AMP-acid ligase II